MIHQKIQEGLNPMLPAQSRFWKKEYMLILWKKALFHSSQEDDEYKKGEKIEKDGGGKILDKEEASARLVEENTHVNSAMQLSKNVQDEGRSKKGGRGYKRLPWLALDKGDNVKD